MICSRFSFTDSYVRTTKQEPGQTLIKASELSYDREIARGNYGTVYKGRCRGFPVAIKLLHNQHLIEPKIEELKREVEIMRCTSCLLFLSFISFGLLLLCFKAPGFCVCVIPAQRHHVLTLLCGN